MVPPARRGNLKEGVSILLLSQTLVARSVLGLRNHLDEICLCLFFENEEFSRIAPQTELPIIIHLRQLAIGKEADLLFLQDALELRLLQDFQFLHAVAPAARDGVAFGVVHAQMDN